MSSVPLQSKTVQARIGNVFRQGFRWDYLPDDATTSIACEYNDRGNGRLERFVQVCECLEIKHVDFVDEEYSGHQLGNALVNIFVDHFVYLQPKFVWKMFSRMKLFVRSPVNPSRPIESREMDRDEMGRLWPEGLVEIR